MGKRLRVLLKRPAAQGQQVRGGESFVSLSGLTDLGSDEYDAVAFHCVHTVSFVAYPLSQDFDI